MISHLNDLSFRTVLPEPLNKVLEPMSIHHLDMPEEDVEVHREKTRRSSLVRHGSVGTSEDPGVIGPIVWNMHCQRLQHGNYKYMSRADEFEITRCCISSLMLFCNNYFTCYLRRL